MALGRVAITLVCSLGLAAQAHAQYTVQFLPHPDSQPAGEVTPYAVNNNGQVFGRNFWAAGTPDRGPVLWTNGVPAALPLPAGYRWYDAGFGLVNDAGVVLSIVQLDSEPVGGGNGVRPVVWQNGVASVVPVPISLTACGSRYSGFPAPPYVEEQFSVVPYGLNNAGHILINACNSLWIVDSTGAVIAAGPPPTFDTFVGLYPPYFVTAFDGNHLNDADVASVESGYNAGSLQQRHPGLFSGLSSFFPLPMEYGEALGINNQNQMLTTVLGVGCYFWDGASLVSLGGCAAPSLNNLGQVSFMIGSPSQLWLYKDGVFTLIPPPAQVPGVQFTAGQGLNDGGQIMGEAYPAGVLLTPPTVSVTVDTAPSGLTILVDGVSATAPSANQWTINSQHQLSTNDPQQVAAGSRLKFSSWSDGGALTHTVTTPFSPAAYTATFKTQYLLTTSANPPAGGSITAGDWFDSGTSVAITAAAAAGYSFAGFSGDLSGTVNPGSVTMDAVRTVTANFKGVTTTGLSTSPNPSVVGQPVTFTSVVTSAVGIPTGTVTFSDGGASIGTGNMNGSGQATFSTSSLSAGTHTITAQYGGDASFGSSTSAPVSQAVNGNTPTTVALRTSADPVAAGQALTLTATVASGSGRPSGQVTFFNDGAAIGTSPLVLVKNKPTATLTTSVLTAGTHVLTAMYMGDVSFSHSTSSPLAETVYSGTRPASTSTMLASSLNPSLAGQAITFTATVKASGKGATPTGIVQFFADANAIGSAALVGGKNGSTAQVTGIQLGAGSHAIIAVYLGDAGSAGSTSAPVNQVVQ